MQDFNMEFARLTTGEIIAQANDPNLLSHMDREDLLGLVQNLSDRLETAYYNQMSTVGKDMSYLRNVNG